MRNLLIKGRECGVAAAGYVRKNMWAVFFLAFMLGGAVKLVASEYITMGYNDYTVEKHANIDFDLLQQEAKKKQQGPSVDVNTQQ